MFLLRRKGYFYVQYLDETENRIKRISTGATRQREALKFLTEFKERLAARPKTNFKTLSAFADEYVGYLYKTHSVKYTRDAKAAFRKLSEWIRSEQDFTSQRDKGDVPLNELNPITLETFFAASFKRAQFETARNYRTLKAAFNHAMERNYISNNPLTKIKLPKLPKAIPSFITEIELSQIIKETKNTTLKDIFLCGFNTGMRLSEMLNLTWNAVKLSERIITVSNTESFTTKNKRERVIPINDTLFAMLERRKPKVLSIDGNNLVFGKTQIIPFSVNYVSRKFKEAARKAGLSDRLHTHSLRHSFASVLLQRWASIKTVQELLGHGSLNTTMIYAHVRREDLANAVKMLEKGV